METLKTIKIKKVLLPEDITDEIREIVKICLIPRNHFLKGNLWSWTSIWKLHFWINRMNILTYCDFYFIVWMLYKNYPFIRKNLLNTRTWNRILFCWFQFNGFIINLTIHRNPPSKPISIPPHPLNRESNLRFLIIMYPPKFLYYLSIFIFFSL